MLKVNEIFFSIQGEGTSSGLPCVFIRLTYCNLRCTYCDTEYSFFEGKDYELEDILSEVKKYGCNLVEVTGGEPLVQKETPMLLTRLCDEGFDVMLETAGNFSLEDVDKRVKIIMDLKCPTSGMEHKNYYENVKLLKTKGTVVVEDEIKFVIGSKEDYDWVRGIMLKYDLETKFHVLLSPVFESQNPRELAEWILHDKLNVRLQLQIHKFIWEPDKRGV